MGADAGPEPRGAAGGSRLDRALLPLLLAAVAWLQRACLGLPLRNADDWFHVDVAAGLLRFDPAAIGRAVAGYGATDTLRPVPWLLWAGDLLLFGTDGAGYYATNLGLHLLIVAGVYVLARQLGAGGGGALAGGAVVGFHLGTGQGMYYLAARDDQAMTVLVLALLTLWPRLRGTRRGRAVAVALYAAAVLCKPPAVAALALLWLVDRGTSPRRTWLPFLAVAGVWAVTLAALLGSPGGLRARGAGTWEAPILGLRTLVAPASSIGVARRSFGQDGARWIAPAALGLLVLLARRTPRDAIVGGLGWLALTLPIPMLYLAGRSVEYNDTGRQLLLPSIGLGLIASAAAPRDGAARIVGVLAGGAVLLSFALPFRAAAPTFLERPEPAVDGFVDAVTAHEGPLVVALQRPNASLGSLLTSGALVRMAGGTPPIVALQGGESAWAVVPEPYGYGRLTPAPWPEGPVLAESYGERGEPPPAWPTWTVWTPPRRAPGDLAQAWSFAGGAAGWGAWPSGSTGHLGLPRHVPGEGFVVDATIRMPEGEVASQLAQEGKPGILLSPPLEIPAADVCAIDLDLDLSAVRSQPGGSSPLLPGGRFALLTWSEDEALYDAWRGVIAVPVGLDGEATARLDRSLPWSQATTVRRLGLLASNGPGRVVIRGLSLRWCR